MRLKYEPASEPQHISVTRVKKKVKVLGGWQVTVMERTRDDLQELFFWRNATDGEVPNPDKTWY